MFFYLGNGVVATGRGLVAFARKTKDRNQELFHCWVDGLVNADGEDGEFFHVNE